MVKGRTSCQHGRNSSEEAHSGSELVEEHKTITVFVSVSRCSLPSFLENRAVAPARFQMYDSSDCWNREEGKTREKVQSGRRDK